MLDMTVHSLSMAKFRHCSFGLGPVNAEGSNCQIGYHNALLHLLWSCLSRIKVFNDILVESRSNIWVLTFVSARLVGKCVLLLDNVKLG